jgi:hypothetical protein
MRDGAVRGEFAMLDDEMRQISAILQVKNGAARMSLHKQRRMEKSITTMTAHDEVGPRTCRKDWAFQHRQEG